MRSSRRFAHDVADSIREMILDNKINTGEPIDELDLSARFGVSRTPVRESMTILEKEGLVRIIPGRGSFVVELGINDYREINSLRMVLEPMAAVQSMEHISGEEIDEQMEIWNDIAAKIRAGEQMSYREVYQREKKLHSILIDRCGNTRLINFLWTLRFQSQRFILSVWKDATFNKDIAEEHIKILNCLKERDAKRLSEAIAGHVVIYNSYIVQGFF